MAAENAEEPEEMAAREEIFEGAVADTDALPIGRALTAARATEAPPRQLLVTAAAAAVTDDVQVAAMVGDGVVRDGLCCLAVNQVTFWSVN